MWAKAKHLSMALAITGLSLIVSASLLLYSYYQKQTLQQQRQAQQQQLALYQQQYQTRLSEQRFIKQYWPVYQSMLQDGYIGEERRDVWLQALAQAQQSQHLFAAEFELGPSEPYQIATLADAKNIVRSVMHISLPMLHEEDLFKLIQSMRQNIKQAWVLRQCEITRLNSDENSLAPHLRAQCELDWLSLAMPQTVNTTAQP
jgi:hypothetical protein